MICPKAGAATVPPKIEPACGSSTTTAHSSCGFVGGREADERRDVCRFRVFAGAGSTLLAVPVLPASCVAGDRDLARGAAGAEHAFEHLAHLRPPSRGEMTRRPAGSGRGLPPTELTMCGGRSDAAVGDRRVGGRHLHRRHELALADRQVAHRGARVVVERQRQARFLARQVRRRCGAPKPKRCTQLLKRARPRACRSRSRRRCSSARGSATVVSDSSPCSVSSWIVRSATWILSGT